MRLPEHSIFGSTKLGASISRGRRIARARIALVAAIVLHLIVIALLPAFPPLDFSAIDRSGGLSIFLNQRDDEHQFERELNQAVAHPDETKPLSEPLLGAASSATGEDKDVSEETAKSQSPAMGGVEVQIFGAKTAASAQPILRITRSMISVFAEQEAARYAQEHPDKVEGFRRTFNSRQNYRRRNQIASYKNRYGDYYRRSSSSVGDICYKLKRETMPQDFATNIVDFFRCDSEPIKLDRDSGG